MGKLMNSMLVPPVGKTHGRGTEALPRWAESRALRTAQASDVLTDENRLLSTAGDISDELLACLKEDMLTRRIGRGLRTLERCAYLIDSFDPLGKNSAPFLGLLAQWVELGFGRRNPELVMRLLGEYGKDARFRLPLSEYMHIRMVEGIAALSIGAVDVAVGHFDTVLALSADIGDWEHQVLANHSKASCHHCKGENDSALAYAVKARELALGRGEQLMAAVIRVQESWLLFLKDKRPEAVQALEGAEAVLADTDDYVTLGNIQATRAQILHRQGRYAPAVVYFRRAIEQFQKRDADHPNLARALMNTAHAQRLVADQFRRKIDSDAARRHQTVPHPVAAAARQPLHDKLRQLHEDAVCNLDSAYRIYERIQNDRGRAAVHLNRGYLALDRGRWDDAVEEAGKAFALSAQMQDYSTMAQSRTLQCMVENARVEEGVEDFTDPGSHAQTAHDYARDAIELATRAQNRRLLAHVYIWYGLTLANDFFNLRKDAREALSQAKTFFDAGVYPEAEGDPVWEDLQKLNARVLEKAEVNATLLEWSNGNVGRKKFRQLEQDFADLIIPRVWEQEGRKVSRVAARLSISRKKVRQVLARLALHEESL
jgi:tetratricopeptide (TPR) repeat protein